MRALFWVFSLASSADLETTCEKGEKLVKQSKQETFCNGITDRTVRDRCVCKGDRTRAEPGGKCVKSCATWREKQCEPSGRKWKDCLDCTQDCGEPMKCFNFLPGQCPGGCVCERGSLWDPKANKCVPERECNINKCPENESFDMCGFHPSCDKTCQDQGPKMCPKGNKSCVARCDCDTGFLRDEVTGKCVPKGQCPISCPANEEFKKCASACEQTCDAPSPDVPCVKNNKICIPKCVCQTGFVRLADGAKCVPERQCPGKPDKCPTNETFNRCGTACEETCNGVPNDGICIKGNKKCVPQCECDVGFVRFSTGGKCVRKKQCPATPPKCPINQKWVECPLCDQKCGFPEVCIFMDQCPFGESCPCPVKPRCQCEKGFVEDPNDPTKCIVEKLCGVCMKRNEKWNICGSACEKTCQNRHDQHLVCTLACSAGCECEKGFIRDEVSGECVSEAKCPTQTCGKNEFFNDCIVRPEEKCGKQKFRRESPIVGCLSKGCECVEGFVRQGDACIPKEACPKACAKNEEWLECGISCGPQCVENPAFCIGVCQPGCFCKKGFLKDMDGRCMPEELCPKECGANEEWKTCGRKCEPSCKNLVPECTKECVPPKCECKKGYVRDVKGKCVPQDECVPNVTECDDRTVLNVKTGECDCRPGFQRHSDGKCYAFLRLGAAGCDFSDVDFLPDFISKKCPDNKMLVNDKCRLNCKYDRRNRSEKFPKLAFLWCVSAVNEKGKVIGAELKYQNEAGYDFYKSVCGKGCNMAKLKSPSLMGSTAESTNCKANKQGFIPFTSFDASKKCTMRCRRADSPKQWTVVRKPMKCVCEDNASGDGRECEWHYINSPTPSEAFDKKFWKAQTLKFSLGKCAK